MHINVVVIGHVDSGKSTTTGKHTATATNSPPPSNDGLTIHNRSLDLQVRWNRQAYHREVREGMNYLNYFAVFHHSFHASILPLTPLSAGLGWAGLSQILPLGGAFHNRFFCAPERSRCSARLASPRLAAIAAQQPHHHLPIYLHARQHHRTAPQYHITISYLLIQCLLQSLTLIIGSRRIGQGFFQVCVGS